MSAESISRTDNSQSSNLNYNDDPLFLSNSDQPNLQIVASTFDGNNFLNWKRDVLMVLEAKNKEGFVNGSQTMPEVTSKDYKRWHRCDLTIRMWILNSITKTIADGLRYVNSAKQLWTEILERYGQTNGPHLYQIKKDLGNISQENAPVVEHYSKLKRAWEDIDSLDPIPDCTCGAMKTCSCSLLKRLLERESNSKLIHFLLGLNSGFDSVKENILTMEPLPPINKALFLLQQIERQKMVYEMIDNVTETNALVATRSDQFRKDSRDTKKQKLDRKCSHCHQRNHVRETCWKLHGYPDQYSNKEKGKSGGKSGMPYTNYSSNNTRVRTVHAAAGGSAAKFVVHNAKAYEDNPLETIVGCTSASSADQKLASLDPGLVNNLVSTVMQEVMKALGDKQSGITSNLATTQVDDLHYAGPSK